MKVGEKASTGWDRAKEEVKERLSSFEPTRLPDDMRTEIKAIMHSYARSKTVEKLPEIGSEWDG
jgi:hypothetical protein